MEFSAVASTRQLIACGTLVIIYGTLYPFHFAGRTKRSFRALLKTWRGRSAAATSSQHTALSSTSCLGSGIAALAANCAHLLSDLLWFGSSAGMN